MILRRARAVRRQKPINWPGPRVVVAVRQRSCVAPLRSRLSIARIRSARTAFVLGRKMSVCRARGPSRGRVRRPRAARCGAVGCLICGIPNGRTNTLPNRVKYITSSLLSFVTAAPASQLAFVVGDELTAIAIRL
ncbi:hypothetical protein EVAR_54742_1 [Eumeta japonica]|uniref:Uncharacterized protein n=1 Tax=Eumeta variegata TaxID=151549 RepID=A0A4C1YZX6_EUMVA|nr:hypothetical protein EVAR_54742_1 [Eumeta japonica]